MPEIADSVTRGLMDHKRLYKRDRWYGAFPVLDDLPDGRLYVRLRTAIHSRSS